MSEYIPPIQTLLASANPTTPRTVRRMKIYFQPSPNDPNILGANENDPPVAPAIDSNIDIAISNKKQYLRYAVDRSERLTANNPTPLNPDSTEQKTYINKEPRLNYSGIPNAFNVFSNSPTMFENEILTSTRDPEGGQVHIINTEVGAIKGFYAGNVGRPFAIRKYIGQLNALETSDPDSDAQKKAHHNRLVDAQLLKFRGANSQTKRVPPAGGDPETRDNPITLGNMFYQGGLGKSTVGTYVREDTSKATPLTVEQLKQVGLNIVFNAVGGNDIDVNIRTPGDAALAELALAAPIGPRIGQKVKLSRFSAAREAQKLFGATKSSSTTFIDTDDHVDSYGSFNNPFSQFDALVSVGQIAVTVAMVLAFVTILSGIVGLVSLSKDKTIRPGYNTDTFENDLVKGSYKLHGKDTKVYPTQVSDDLGDFLVSMMGVSNIFSKPKYDFEDCLSQGIKEFFGFSPSGGSFATTSMKIMTESGRLNVILREMIRSGVDLGESAEAAFTGTGASSPITGVVGFIRSLFDLKIIKFINVLVNIGDKVLEGNAGMESVRISESLSLTSNIGGVDSLPDEGFLIQKSRLSSDGTLAWSTTTAPYYSLTLETLAPITFVSLFDRLQSDLNLPPDEPPNSTNQRGTPSSGRISAAEVKVIEHSLDSDYMPFYFHDLRTNEIMSFHAFLENASEDFNIEYTSQEGYGRMDKVQIYKGTTRNITVDFKMIATSAESHDDMWYKINRLAMMIYPQWTQGRKLDVGNLRFIQPFSQIPGATPVIRLRLGDIYKSNYSKMAVARLFGATTRGNYNVDSSVTPAPETPAPATPTTPETPTATAAAVASRQQLLARKKFTINDPSTAITDIENFEVTPTVTAAEAAAAMGSRLPPSRRRGRQPSRHPSARFTDVFTIDTSYIVLNVGPFLKLELRRGFNILLVSGPASSIMTIDTLALHYAPVKLLVLAKRASGRYIDVQPIHLYGNNDSTLIFPVQPQATTRPNIRIPLNIFNHPDFIDYPATARYLAREIAAANNTNNSNNSNNPTVDPNPMNPSTFYGPNNPILKAFNSTAGKGLAGVITSFKVDYKESDKRWGIDAENKLRAPMYVTISVTMAVIHDIPLGLDSNGIMNAPIWPVGNRSNYFMRNSNDEM